jgi:hypothetical protein
MFRIWRTAATSASTSPRGVELAETDPRRSFGKSPNGLVRRRGAMQSGAHRDPERLIEDRPGEGDVFGVEPKRADAGTEYRLAIDADAINLPHPVRQHPCQVSLVLGDGVYADRSDEADPGGQPGDAGQIGGAGLDPLGVLLGLFRAFRIEAGSALAKGLYRQSSGEHEHAGAHRSLEPFVSRCGQDIHAQILHVDVEISGALCRVRTSNAP